MGLSFEEEKEERKVVAVKFSFKKTTVHKVVNQYTGKTRNVYTKPKAKVLEQKERVPGLVQLSDKISERLAHIL